MEKKKEEGRENGEEEAVLEETCLEIEPPSFVAPPRRPI
jgi:hypothetical protein